MERSLATNRSMVSYLVKIGLLSALAFILMFLDFPIPLFPAFLKMDFGDVPALIAGFSLGPVAGVFVQLIKNILYFFTKSSTMGVGSLGNFLTGVTLIVPAALIYRRMHTRGGALLGVLVGTAVMALFMAVFNYYVLIPLYITVLGFSMEAVVGMGTAVNANITDLRSLVILGVTPFNIFKGLAVSLVTFLLYKHLSPILRQK
ncbi:MAG: ECF transporter S component [Firmicutes bacterium]|nr:ECF transporter S component [Bacillota bacterium]